MASIEEVTSRVSVPYTFCNVPDPYSITANFVYNFYVKDEDKQSHPLPTSPIDYSAGLIGKDTLAVVEQKERGALTARVPRFIRINIAPDNTKIEKFIDEDLKKTVRFSKEYNLEGNISNDYVASISLSDNNVKTRIQELIYRINTSLFNDSSIEDAVSDGDIAKRIDDLTSDEVDITTILDALSDNELKGYKFINSILVDRFSRIDERAASSYQTKFNGDGYRKITNSLSLGNPLSYYYLSDLLGRAGIGDTRYTTITNSLMNSRLIPSFDEKNEIESLKANFVLYSSPEYRSTDLSVFSSFPRIRSVGYIIEKTGVSPEGAYTTYDDTVLTDPDSTEFIDPNVIYGHTYSYRARHLYLIEFLHTDILSSDGEKREKIISAYVASSSPKQATVKAVESMPPNPPGTLICTFLYSAGNGLRLDWQRPSNPQRDIKKYQVFRRASINDAFELIAEYDFTDPGYTMFVKYETVSQSLVRRSESPVYYHIDPDFSRESSFIYTVASVDAHGFVSSYGTQIQVDFDRFSNKIRTELVSQPGAPRAYPNYYVNPTMLEQFGSDRLIEDAIKDSGHATARVYFDPTVFKVSSDDSNNQTDPGILPLSKGKYVFQILNLDRQISKNLNIEIAPDDALSSIM